MALPENTINFFSKRISDQQQQSKIYNQVDNALIFMIKEFS